MITGVLREIIGIGDKTREEEEGERDVVQLVKERGRWKGSSREGVGRKQKELWKW